MTIEFIQVRLDHAEAIHRISDLVAEERKYILRVEAPSIEEIREGIDCCAAQGGVYLVALDGEGVIGYSVLTRYKRTGMQHVGALSMLLLPEFRGRGIGTDMLKATLEKCRQGEIWRVELGVYPHNESAMAMYRKMGFEEEGITPRGRVFEELEDDFTNMALLLETRPPRLKAPPSQASLRRGGQADARNVEILPAALKYAPKIYRTVDAVARERRWIGMVTGPDLDSVKKFIQDNLTARNPHLLAIDGEEVVGWADITRLLREGQRHIGYLGMGLIPAYRGLGIGTRLLDSVISWAKKEGMRQIQLDVWASNSAGRALYLGRGFEQITHKHRARYIDGYEDDMISMQKMLDV